MSKRRRLLRDVYRHSVSVNEARSWRGLPPHPTDEEVVRAIRLVPPHFAGMSSITGTKITAGFQWTCANNLTGGAYQPISNPGNIQKVYNFGTANGNTTSGGGDEVFSFQQGITAGSSATIDLTAMTNLLQQTGVNIARIKSYMIRLLSAADDGTITPAPNANSKIVVTNNGPATPAQLDFGNGLTGLTLTLTVVAGAVTGVSIGAAGSGGPPSSTFVVGPCQAGGSGAVIAVTTNASGVPTSVSVVTGGAGYSATTVPAVVLGQYLLNTGDAHLCLDNTALGQAITSTSKSLRIYNLDGSNAVTPEFDFFAATT